MGVDTSATHTIFFIAAVVLAAMAVGIFNQSVQKFSTGVDDRSNSLAQELSSDIRIINDPVEVPNSPLVLYVLNTGTASLAPGETVVLVNGQAYLTLSLDVLETTDEVWRAGQVLQVTVTGLNLPNGDHRVKVIAQNGVADTIRFSV